MSLKDQLSCLSILFCLACIILHHLTCINRTSTTYKFNGLTSRSRTNTDGAVLYLAQRDSYVDHNRSLRELQANHVQANNTYYQTVWPGQETELNPQVDASENKHKSIGSATSGTRFKMQRTRRFHTPAVENQILPFPSDNYPTGTKWAVITSIFMPTHLIKTLLSLQGWCTVIVTDIKGPEEHTFLNALDGNHSRMCFVYLSIEKQLKLEYNIIQSLPFNSFGRKNIGYIFAIHHGAQTIYDTDDDNDIKDIDLLQFWSSPSPGEHYSMPSMQWSGSNPYSGLGGKHVNIWPRGIPLDKIKYKPLQEYGTFNEDEITKPIPRCIVQSLADQEPDVDAIYRLTSENYPVFINPETRWKASLVRPGIMSPFNAQATIFFEPAFPSLLLPITVHGRVSDIWRGYVAQALQRATCPLIFTPPWVIQNRNKHDYLMDFNAELPLYQQTGALLEFLTNNTFTTHIEAITALYEHEILDESDVHLSMAWVADLQRAKLSYKIGTQTRANDSIIYHRHLLIMMGRGAHLKSWMELILNTPKLSHIELILGIFDDDVRTLECDQTPDRIARVKCLSVAGTTWTTGRNVLVAQAFALERERSKHYSFWTLADADIRLHCQDYVSPDATNCIEQYDRFLATLPREATAAALLQSGSWPVVQGAAMVKLQAMDAAWNSFRREVVHILFPYQPDQDANTWWSSQAIFWNKLQCLAPLYVVAPLFVFYANHEHNEYPRNPRDFAAEHRIAMIMMGGLAGMLPRAPSDYIPEIRQDKVMPLPLTSDQPIDNVFHLCTKEFSSTFHSFVLAK